MSVEVDGQTSECHGNDCKFSYHHGWYHTPRIYSLTPMSVGEGSILRVEGRFHKTPFEFEELRAPSMEIPLASVKIANRAEEAQRAENEPFGKSGTRCALFDQEIEEPYGVGEVHGHEVREFKCQVNGPREAGRYNLSVALLGTKMANDWHMNMGEAHVDDKSYQADHEGVSFMLQHVATVTAVTPTSSGLQGGARLTISGNGFSNNKSLVEVRVGGDDCHVQVATMSVIECVLARRGRGYRQGELQPGSRGVRRRIWVNGGRQSISALRASSDYNKSDVTESEKSLLESPVNFKYLPDPDWVSGRGWCFSF